MRLAMGKASKWKGELVGRQRNAVAGDRGSLPVIRGYAETPEENVPHEELNAGHRWRMGGHVDETQEKGVAWVKLVVELHRLSNAQDERCSGVNDADEGLYLEQSWVAGVGLVANAPEADVLYHELHLLVAVVEGDLLHAHDLQLRWDDGFLGLLVHLGFLSDGLFR